jgi:hypothetical protein
MYELIITDTRVGEADGFFSRVYRYEYDTLAELEHVLECAHKMALDGGKMKQEFENDLPE